ncbi:MAG: hypothetical protein P4L76_13060 [Beijerinckiaceae bacterium]|nr:hypothetical protein [Beijerinckiaceae bacterium]
MNKGSLTQSAIDHILARKELFISPRKNKDRFDLIPVLQYCFRSYATYKDGTQRGFGSGFTLFFKTEREISQYDYEKIDIGSNSFIALGGVAGLGPEYRRIDWGNGKFCWV